MFRAIVVGCDGFDRGRQAVAYAATLADAGDARLLLVTAHPPFPPAPPEALREQAEQLGRAVRRVRDELAPRATPLTVAALSPAHALRDVARRERAELIVVGSRAESASRGPAEVEHALQVLHAASRTVAVVPDGTPVGRRLGRIVVGFDGSPEARAAVELAADLARRARARLRIEMVVDAAPSPWSSPRAPDDADRRAWVDSRRSAALDLVERLVDELPDVAADGGVRVGEPARELVLAAERGDLLVLGSRRWGPPGRLALGRTSEAIVRCAAGAVLVLPRAEADRGDAPPALAAGLTRHA